MAETALETVKGEGGSGAAKPVVGDVARVRTMIVNLYFVGEAGAGDRGWVMVDAGMQGTAPYIAKAAADRFGEGARPSAIVLTHGHFDHVGALRTLAEKWDVPVYAHELELPYVTGRSDYPPPDPTVGGGAMAALSWLYPKHPIDLGGRARMLPADGSVPAMPGWRWIHTPGHSPGHVSLFRDRDRTLIAGDAFVTTKQESAVAALMQPPEVHGPPMYFTADWRSARRSVEALAALEPEVAATGHGLPLRGASMQRALHELAEDFQRLAVPARGRYVDQPAVTDERGVVSLPPSIPAEMKTIMLGLGAAVAVGFALGAMRGGERD